MFEAANSDHAVTGAIFQISLAQPLADQTLTKLWNSHGRFRDDLPAASLGSIANVEMTPEGPRVSQSQGLEFQFLRPDGSPAWALRVAGSEIAIGCNRYTRWKAVSSKAFELLEKVFSLIGEEGGNGVESSMLLFRDDFFWKLDVDSYDLSKLFVVNDIVPPSVFSRGPVWHSHLAWFEQRNEPISTLIHLNIDATMEQQEALARSASAQVAVTNFQTTRFREMISIKQIVDDLDKLFGSFEIRHKRNLELMKSILTSDMQNIIGLQ